MQRDQAAANKLTRLGLSATGTTSDRRGKKDAELIDVEWTTLRHFSQGSGASQAIFSKLSEFPAESTD